MDDLNTIAEKIEAVSKIYAAKSGITRDPYR